jgi:hypothetical protein
VRTAFQAATGAAFFSSEPHSDKPRMPARGISFFIKRRERGLPVSQSQETSPRTGNRLLDSLPPEDYERLAPELKPVTFALGDVIYESQKQMAYVFFPTTSHTSLLYTMLDGSTAEVGLVGNEGLVGIALFMGGDTTPNQAIVQGAGDALKMSAEAMNEEFRRGGAFQLSLLRYTQALITQISQTAVCNRLHTTEQRLCRWMLMTHDRTQFGRFANDARVHLAHARHPARSRQPRRRPPAT